VIPNYPTDSIVVKLHKRAQPEGGILQQIYHENEIICYHITGNWFYFSYPIFSNNYFFKT